MSVEYNLKPIHQAALAGDAKAVQAELDKGVPVDLPDDVNCTALSIACCDGHLEVVKLVVERKANVDGVPSWTTITGLQYAARNGHAEIVDVLIAAKANVDQKSQGWCAACTVFRLLKVFFRTALMYASHTGHATIVSALLAAKADASMLDLTGKTALQIATAAAHHKVVALLTQASTGAVSASPSAAIPATPTSAAAAAPVPEVCFDLLIH